MVAAFDCHHIRFTQSVLHVFGTVLFGTVLFGTLLLNTATKKPEFREPSICGIIYHIELI